ncbi:GNAT family N-acetyltransferase [Streptomyces sp. NPDC017529]|uniref:GNAT family N-acetyltransferase n=1 Tax=Streptomyces sp. NPDC017529 TaxID=3365000 RepID=UPI003788F47F
MLPELVRTWVAGWAVSRRTPRPTEQPWGLHIEVGLPHQAGRHVLPEPDEPSVRAAATTAVTVPRTWLKVPLEPDVVEPWLPEGWVVDRAETGHLMAVDLRTAHRPALPDGYTTTTQTREGVTYVQVHAPTGEPAAKGQAAVIGHATVIDQVSTEPAHRRRGLGRHVMHTLTDHALDEGSALGILGATDEGRALYESLGWKAHAPLAACIHRP